MSDPVRDGVRCMLMRGGTSKGAYFVAADVPLDPAERDELLLRVMGSPDPTQIDGLGGAHPLTSKVAIVSPSSEPGADVFIDDEKIGTTPLPGPVLVDVGTRKIRVSKPGFKEFVKVEAVAGAGDVSVTADLAKDIHQGRLVVEAGAKDAIFIDGKAVATGKWEGVLPSGGHSLGCCSPSSAHWPSSSGPCSRGCPSVNATASNWMPARSPG